MSNRISNFYKETSLSIKMLFRRNPNVSVFIIYGLLFDTVLNMWKPFSVKFLSRLGGMESDISLLNALPGIVAALVLIPSSFFISKFKAKKRITTYFFMASRLMLLVAAFIPFLPKAVQPMLFVLLISVMNFPDAVSQTALQGVLGNAFDGRTRAHAITLRNQFGNIAVPLITITTGLMMTIIPKNDTQKIIMYQIFFVLAFLVGIAEIVVFNRFREDSGDAEPSPSQGFNVKILTDIFKDKTFRRFWATALFFMFFWQAGWPLCGIYQTQNLKADEFWFAAFSVTTGIGAFLSGGFWQSVIRKSGNETGLFLGALLLAANVALFPLCKTPAMMAILCFFSGFASIGFSICNLNGLLGATPDDNKLLYLGVYNTLSNFGLFAASLLSLLLFNLVGIIGALYIVGCCRLVGAAAIFIFYKPKAAG